MMGRIRRVVGIAVALLLAVGHPSAPAAATALAADPGFRLLAPAVKFGDRNRADLLTAGYTAKVLSPKNRITTGDCAERPQFGDAAQQLALAKTLFTLPAQLGKSMSCSMRSGSALLIDHIGVICNDSKHHQASVACVEDRFRDLHDYRVTFDGVDLGAQRFKVITEQFVIDLEHDSPFGLNKGRWRLRAGGWPLLLDKLTPGQHTVVTSYKLGKSKQKTTVLLDVVA